MTTPEAAAPARRTPADLSAAKRALLDQRLRGRAGRPGIPRQPEGATPPLSFAQERLWFMEQLAPGTVAYHVPVLLHLTAPADASALSAALDDVAARHEALRMRFPASEDGTPLVVVNPPQAGIIPLDTETASSAADAERLARAAATGSFNVATGPLLRARLIRCPDAADDLLVLAAHHIACDGWSTEVLIRDLLSCYTARQSGAKPALPPLTLQYGDVAAWQRDRFSDERGQRAAEYWRQRLAGVSPLDLPTDRPRPAAQTFQGATHRFRLPTAVAARLDALAHAENATLYMALMAAFQAVLACWSRQRVFAVGSPVAGRAHPDLDDMVGMFVNMLAVRADLDGDPSFRQLLARVRHIVLDGLDHQDVPFEHLVNLLGVPRDVSRPPVFQVMLAVQNYGMASPAGDAMPSPAWKPIDVPATRFDLELHVYTDTVGMACSLVYNTALFDSATIGRFAVHLGRLIAAAVDYPDVPITAIDLLGDAERAQLDAWNDTCRGVSWPGTLATLVDAALRRDLTAVAVQLDGAGWTCGDLDDRAERIALCLQGLGAGPGDLVGVCAERSFELVAALVGVLRCGAAYVPLDPEYPMERLEFMAADAGLAAVLTTEAVRGRVPHLAAPVITVDECATWPRSQEQLISPAGPADDAYLIYTSGSTGRPKGAANSHRAIVNRLHWMQRYYPIGPDDAVLQKTPTSFDVSVWEFFWPLLTGARLVLARPGGHRDADYLRTVITTAGITTLHFVPSMLAPFLADEGAGGCTTLRQVICSGEELPLDLARLCLARLPNCALYNLYGPTEAAVDVTTWPCEAADLAGRTSVPIGQPADNVTVYVLDERLQRVPIGVPGELCIGGVQVARGYHQRPALTAERFTPDPYSDGGRLYRTGDLVRWRADGTLEFLSRLDHQVKLRGLRIELGEIESALRRRPDVSDAVVVMRDDDGDKQLIGYVTGAGDADRAGAAARDWAAALRVALKEELPDYMIPAAVVVLGALPLTPSGKLDRAALPAPVRERDTAQVLVAPSTPAEHAVAGIWREVLGLAELGVDDDFFDLGGHSLLATQVVARLRRHAGLLARQVGVMDVFTYRTVRELAAFASHRAAPDEPSRLLHRLTPAAGSRALAASYVCIPYGGGSAVVYQPLADALPEDRALWAVAIPGHDIGLDEDSLPFDELAARCTEEILARVEGPLVLYGHCGVGGALIVELARRIEAAGRDVQAVYVGGIFPFPRPRGALRITSALDWLESNRNHANWLKSMGVDMDGIDPEHADRIIANMRHDGRQAEKHFTALLDHQVVKLRAPIITVVGERDPVTDYYEERFREWQFLADSVAVVVLGEAGHFFLKYRAAELADIITQTHPAVTAHEVAALAPARHRDNGWWLYDARWPGRDGGHPVTPEASRGAAPQPSIGRFLAVALGQLVSLTGSGLTMWALPVWLLLKTGSVARFGLLGAAAFAPGLFIAPVAGTVVDQMDRRRVMAAAGVAAAAAEGALAALLVTHHLAIWHIYLLIAALSVASMFQRLAYAAALPQLVPKRYLGQATGLAQLGNGIALLIMPLLAAGLLAALGLGGILGIDIASYAVAVGTLAVVRFPRTMGRRRRESYAAEIAGGLRYSWGNRGLRAMLVLSACINLLLAPILILIPPLVLGFATLSGVGRVSFADALGAVAGGLTMTVWGGPRAQRMRGLLLATLVVVPWCALTGLRPNLLVVAVGVFGTAAGLAVVQSIYMTIVQVKVPQRFHGRVFAINQMIAWSTLPIGFALLAPAASAVFEPLLRRGGPLAASLGAVFGTGPARGLGLLYVVLALGVGALALIGLRNSALGRFDIEVPDALPDDLVGAQELRRQRAGGTGLATPALTTVPRTASPSEHPDA